MLSDYKAQQCERMVDEKWLLRSKEKDADRGKLEHRGKRHRGWTVNAES